MDMEKILILREIGDFCGSGFTWIDLELEGRYYRLVPAEGYVAESPSYVIRVEWMPAQHLTPEIYFGGGYVVRLIPKQPKT